MYGNVLEINNAFFRKLEEAIRESGNPTQKPAPDMERQVHNRYQLHLVRNMPPFSST